MHLHCVSSESLDPSSADLSCVVRASVETAASSGLLTANCLEISGPKDLMVAVLQAASARFEKLHLSGEKAGFKRDFWHDERDFEWQLLRLRSSACVASQLH